MGLSFKMPTLTIGNLTAKLPIVQGGMGVGISLSGLASAVANEGGIGVISATGIGMLEPDFNQNNKDANERALRREIRKARQLTGGILGVNIMVALTDYLDLMRIAVEEEIDVIFIGAGLPLKVTDSLIPTAEKPVKTKLVPIVSSGRAAKIIFHSWEKNFHHVPDGVVVEGPLAGGHLGFKKEQIDDPDYALEKILPDVIAEVKPYEETYSKKIPVIAGGGIFTGADIYRMFKLGVQGVQMATRFVGTHECDASKEFKETYINCKKEDLTIIQSPVGLPGRAIKNKFLEEVSQGKKVPYSCNWHCLRTCDVEHSPYCICVALTNAKKGLLNKGFAFAGANAYLVDKIVSVKELMHSLVEEYKMAAMTDPA
jgi:nitronate monooxygenase